MMPVSADPLTLTVHNLASPDADRAAYPGTNDLRLLLTNSSETPLDLDAASTVTIAFNRFNVDGKSPDVSAVDSQWNAVRLADGRWSLTSSGSRCLEPGGTIEFVARDLLVTGRLGGLAHVVVSYSGIGDHTARVAADVLVERPPLTTSTTAPVVGALPFGNVSWVRSQGAEPGVVFITPYGSQLIRNTLVLELGNPDPNPASAPKVVADPTFELSFLLTDANSSIDPGTALTTLKHAAGALTGGAPITIDLVPPGWERVLPPLQDADARHAWTFRPARMLAPNETVRFVIRNICLTNGFPGETSFDPERTTYVFLKYANVPGFADGGYALPIRKEQHPPVLRRFEMMTPSTIEPGDPVTLRWETSGATRVVLSFESGGVLHERSTDDPNPDLRIGLDDPAFTLQLPPQETTELILDVYDMLQQRVAQERVAVKMRMPRIDLFALKPPAAAQGFALGWTTVLAEACELRDAAGPADVVPVPFQAERHPIIPPVAKLDYELTVKRKTAIVRRRLVVDEIPPFPRDCPLPPFAIDEAFRPVTGATPDEWAANFVGGRRIRTGRYDPAGGFVESGFDNRDRTHGVFVHGSSAEKDLFSYVAVAGPLNAEWAEVGYYVDQARPHLYQGWSGSGWVKDLPRNAGGHRWFRARITWPPTDRPALAMYFARFTQVQVSPGDPPFRMWAFRWNR